MDNTFLLIILLAIGLIAAFQIVKGWGKLFMAAHRQTMKDLHAKTNEKTEHKTASTIETITTDAGHKSIIKNRFDNREYIVSTVRLDDANGNSNAILQCGVFLRTNQSDFKATTMPPLIFFNNTHQMVAATEDQKHVSYIKLPLPFNHFSDKMFHDLIALFIRDHERESWKNAIRQFNTSATPEEILVQHQQ